jgi:hypothetical protein
MLVETGGVCEGVHTTGDTLLLGMKYGVIVWGMPERKAHGLLMGLQIAFRKTRGDPKTTDCRTRLRAAK